MSTNIYDKLRKAFSGTTGLADASDIETTGSSNVQTDLDAKLDLEQMQDAVDTMLIAGTNISLNYDDGAGTLEISVDSGATPTPSLHGFSIDIAPRVDIGTDLNVAHTINYDVSNYSQLTALSLIVTTGDDQTLTLPLSDGLQAESVTLSGINTSIQTSVTFQLSGTWSGGTVTSNVVTITVDNASGDEFIYHGLSASDNPASVSLGTLGSSEVTTSGQQLTFAVGPSTAGDYIILLAPTDHDLTALTNTDTGFSVLSQFTRTADVRVINSVNYHSYVLGPLNAGLTFNYRATVA